MNVTVDAALAEGEFVVTESITEPQALAAGSHAIVVFEGGRRGPGPHLEPRPERLGDRAK